ncbi:peptidoglycan-binding domain-containing protein [Rivularia sp. UHCC 0363]|uniref:peptidoglycan-binding domain-containing protein n=1 Tax=Rivularia sp. UHCC 0363 TaxID=3110244 RepID=UPI002B1F3363|nr:peptidoglycan-binding domain-containing protein [Rivularia sp. UHCC 0363]MEA5596948.1 peptidoglycan-binding domain-containing protein [Rivularia sp. UHCC 0363]
MEPLDNKFQQPEKDVNGKTYQQRVFSVEEQAANGDRAKQVNTNEPAPMSELRKGSRGDMVMKAQRILKTTSDYVGYIDGDFGPYMEAAVQSFQRRSKVPITGVIDNDTWNALKQIR